MATNREKRIREAMNHPDEFRAGAKKRRKLAPDERAEAVMREYYRGTLYSGSKHKVRTQDQARVIARTEANR